MNLNTKDARKGILFLLFKLQGKRFMNYLSFFLVQLNYLNVDSVDKNSFIFA
jgi:hypothetical protein